jgi:uncharacterized membrane protein YgcG
MSAARLLAFVGLVAAAFLLLGPACTTRDCPEERAGQTRCVGNQLETCQADGSLAYESCARSGLVCSEKHGSCVPPGFDASGGGGSGGEPGGGGQTGGAGGAGGSTGGGGG